MHAESKLSSTGSRRRTETFWAAFKSGGFVLCCCSWVWTNLDDDAGLSGFLAVLQQSVSASTGEVVVETVEGLEVVLTPRPASHLPLKAGIWNWEKNISKGFFFFSSVRLNLKSCSLVLRKTLQRCSFKSIYFMLKKCHFKTSYLNKSFSCYPAVTSYLS